MYLARTDTQGELESVPTAIGYLKGERSFNKTLAHYQNLL